MATTTRRLAILVALMERVAEITTANGFASDAGHTVLLGEKVEFGESDPEQAVAVVVLSDIPQHVGENVSMVMPVEFQAIAKADIDQPWIAAEQLLGDIKKAVELPDRTLGGLTPRFIKRGSTRVLPREPGATTVGVGVTYLVPYEEAFGKP
jgi:hypothetical protein